MHNTPNLYELFMGSRYSNNACCTSGSLTVTADSAALVASVTATPSAIPAWVHGESISTVTTTSLKYQTPPVQTLSSGAP